MSYQHFQGTKIKKADPKALQLDGSEIQFQTFGLVRFFGCKAILDSNDGRESGFSRNVLQSGLEVLEDEPDGPVRKYLGPELDDVVVVGVDVPLPLRQKEGPCRKFL